MELRRNGAAAGPFPDPGCTQLQDVVDTLHNSSRMYAVLSAGEGVAPVLLHFLGSRGGNYATIA